MCKLSASHGRVFAEPISVMAPFRSWSSFAQAVVILVALAPPGFAQALPPAAPPAQQSGQQARGRATDILDETPTRERQIDQLRHAVTRLPVAATLACVLALRPRRRGTPPRQ